MRSDSRAGGLELRDLSWPSSAVLDEREREREAERKQERERERERASCLVEARERGEGGREGERRRATESAEVVQFNGLRVRRSIPWATWARMEGKSRWVRSVTEVAVLVFINAQEQNHIFACCVARRNAFDHTR